MAISSLIHKSSQLFFRACEALRSHSAGQNRVNEETSNSSITDQFDTSVLDHLANEIFLCVSTPEGLTERQYSSVVVVDCERLAWHYLGRFSMIDYFSGAILIDELVIMPSINMLPLLQARAKETGLPWHQTSLLDAETHYAHHLTNQFQKNKYQVKRKWLTMASPYAMRSGAKSDIHLELGYRESKGLKVLTRQELHTKIFQVADLNTLVAVHSGRRDLSYVSWEHPNVIDTFAVELEAGLKHPGRLKDIVYRLGGQLIQEGPIHDSVEDCLACREVLFHHSTTVSDTHHTARPLEGI